MTEKHPVNWPKPYLLQIYSRALTEGAVRIKLPDHKAFRSFSQAFYRLRRRSDSQHASFILPEYHLIFCTWEPERSSALIIYDALPDGMQLPAIESVDASERLPEPRRREVAPAVEFDPSSPDFDPEQFVADLVSEAGSKIEVDDSDIS